MGMYSEEFVGKRLNVMEVLGENKERKPMRRWLDTTRNDLSERELSGEEGQDRVQWRCLRTRKHRHRMKGCGRSRLLLEMLQFYKYTLRVTPQCTYTGLSPGRIRSTALGSVTFWNL